MADDSIILVVISSLISGMIGVIVSILYYRKHEERIIKLKTLTKFVGNRFDLTSSEFSQSINEIFIVFCKSRKVMQALSDHHKSILAREPSEDNLVKLYKAMCIDLKIYTTELNDSFFLTPYNTKSILKN